MNKVLCFDKYFTNIFIDISKSPFILLTFFYGSVIINKRCFKGKIKITFMLWQCVKSYGMEAARAQG